MGHKFQCPECEYKAKQKSNVLTHQKSKHMAKNKGNPEKNKLIIQFAKITYIKRFLGSPSSAVIYILYAWIISITS